MSLLNSGWETGTNSLGSRVDGNPGSGIMSQSLAKLYAWSLGRVFGQGGLVAEQVLALIELQGAR